jgi:four helix bundle protein
MSNIAEGFDRSGRREFCQFLSIAKGSVAEVRSLVHYCRDAQMLSEADYLKLLQQCLEASRIIAGLRKSVDPRTKPKAPTKS